MQRERSFIMMRELASTFQVFREFIETTPTGMEMLLDNLDIRNIDDMKVELKGFMSKKEEQAAQQQQMMKQQMASQLQPLQLKAQELALKDKNQTNQHLIDAAKLELGKTEADTKRIETLAKVGELQDRLTLDREKHQAEKTNADIDRVIGAVSGAMNANPSGNVT
jgi:ABC-type oligopeptide transport system ATPase subunit